MKNVPSCSFVGIIWNHWGMHFQLSQVVHKWSMEATAGMVASLVGSLARLGSYLEVPEPMSLGWMGSKMAVASMPAASVMSLAPPASSEVSWLATLLEANSKALPNRGWMALRW